MTNDTNQLREARTASRHARREAEETEHLNPYHGEGLMGPDLPDYLVAALTGRDGHTTEDKR